MRRGDWFSHSLKCGICSLHTVKWSRGLVCTTWDCVRKWLMAAPAVPLYFFFLSLFPLFDLWMLLLQFSLRQNMQSRQNDRGHSEFKRSRRQHCGVLASRPGGDISSCHILVWRKVDWVYRSGPTGPHQLMGTAYLGRREGGVVVLLSAIQPFVPQTVFMRPCRFSNVCFQSTAIQPDGFLPLVRHISTGPTAKPYFSNC